MFGLFLKQLRIFKIYVQKAAYNRYQIRKVHGRLKNNQHKRTLFYMDRPTECIFMNFCTVKDEEAERLSLEHNHAAMVRTAHSRETIPWNFSSKAQYVWLKTKIKLNRLECLLGTTHVVGVGLCMVLNHHFSLNAPNIPPCVSPFRMTTRLKASHRIKKGMMERNGIQIIG